MQSKHKKTILRIKAFSLGTTILNQRTIVKDDIEIATQFPCLLGHPVSIPCLLKNALKKLWITARNKLSNYSALPPPKKKIDKRQIYVWGVNLKAFLLFDDFAAIPKGKTIKALINSGFKCRLPVPTWHDWLIEQWLLQTKVSPG